MLKSSARFLADVFEALAILASARKSDGSTAYLYQASGLEAPCKEVHVKSLLALPSYCSAVLCRSSMPAEPSDLMLNWPENRLSQIASVLQSDATLQPAWM